MNLSRILDILYECTGNAGYVPTVSLMYAMYYPTRSTPGKTSPLVLLLERSTCCKQPTMYYLSRPPKMTFQSTSGAQVSNHDGIGNDLGRR